MNEALGREGGTQKDGINVPSGMKVPPEKSKDHKPWKR